MARHEIRCRLKDECKNIGEKQEKEETGLISCVVLLDFLQALTQFVALMANRLLTRRIVAE